MPTIRVTRSLLVGAALSLLLASVAEAVVRRIFVTSVRGAGELGAWPDAGTATGLAAGDAICRARAAVGGLPNANTYRAWLSTDSTDAYCHVYGLDGQKKGDDCGLAVLVPYGPWYQVNGTVPVSPRLSILTSSADRRVMYSPIAFDESGDPIPYATQKVWTGTTATGVASGDDCFNWSYPIVDYAGTTGGALWAGNSWTYQSTESCDKLRRLICVEPGTADSFEPNWSPGRLTFRTSAQGNGMLSSWTEAGGASGLAAGDAICRKLAADAHLPAASTFFAWLSTATTDAGSRLSGTGAFRRIDGFLVASSNADLVDGSTANSIHVDESGDYLLDYAAVRTGTSPSGTATDKTCNNWLSASAEDWDTVGLEVAAFDGSWTSFGWGTCDAARPLYCFSNTYVIFWDGFDSTGDTGRWSSAAP